MDSLNLAIIAKNATQIADYTKFIEVSPVLHEIVDGNVGYCPHAEDERLLIEIHLR